MRLLCGLSMVALVATCVLADVGVGASCEVTDECTAPNVCVLLDEGDPDSGAVCLPMLDLPAPQACFADEDCPAAGWPVDATCNDEGRCTCGGEGFSCTGIDDEVVGEHTCRCLVPAVLEEACEDDNQCDTGICGNGVCGIGFEGDGCDSDADCPGSINTTCDASICV